eukprot:6047759-Prymnesium_polylepis.1
MADSWDNESRANSYVDRFRVITEPIARICKVTAPTTAELVLVYADDPTRVVEATAFGKEAIF